MSSKLVSKIVVESKEYQEVIPTPGGVYHYQNGYTAVIEDNKIINITEHSLGEHEKLTCKTKERIEDLRDFLNEVLETLGIWETYARVYPERAIDLEGNLQ